MFFRLSFIFCLIPVVLFAQVDLTSKYAILMDAQTGQVLYEKEANLPVPPSSMSKLMALYIVFDLIKAGKLQEETPFLVSETGAYKPASGESAMYLEPGMKVSLIDLIHGISTMSGGDACRVVAENIAGSQEKFVDLMNAYAQELGLKNSHFANASGAYHPNHLMSVQDIALLSQKILKDFPQYKSLFSEKFFDYLGYTASQRKEYEFAMWNRNRLLWTYSGADGLKTGHTDKGGYGLAGTATRKDWQLIAVINGLFTTVGRTSANSLRAKEAGKLLNYGFENFEQKTFFKVNEKVMDIPVFFGREKFVSIVSKEPIRVVLPIGGVSQIYLKVIYDTPLKAPIMAGEKVAELQVYDSDKVLAQYPLFANHTVKRIPVFIRFFENIKVLLKRAIS
ncbi:MAG: D-alanyl-D-alanine carboxypeptidase [Alphaproteobacteria bacterium]|nr:D-alanyl-D-alanine carboxypeptidase [Alphaproteobacteria bacterium]